MTTATATATRIADAIAYYDRSRAVEMSQSDWDTIRTALLCYAGDQREAGNDAWSRQIMGAYRVIRDQTT